MNTFNKIKNILGQKINPATQETLEGIKTKSDLLTFDSGVNPGNLNVNVTVGNVGLKNNIHGIATKATLDTVAGKTASLTFDNSSALVTTGLAPTLASAIQINDKTNTPANEIVAEKLILWRRMVKLMESQATVSSTKYFETISPNQEPGNCQRIIIDGWDPAVVYGSGPSDWNVPMVTVSTGSITTPTGITQATAGTNYSYMGWNNRKFVDVARIAYAKNIRRNLSFT